MNSCLKISLYMKHFLLSLLSCETFWSSENIQILLQKMFCSSWKWMFCTLIFANRGETTVFFTFTHLIIFTLICSEMLPKYDTWLQYPERGRDQCWKLHPAHRDLIGLLLSKCYCYSVKKFWRTLTKASDVQDADEVGGGVEGEALVDPGHHVVE